MPDQKIAGTIANEVRKAAVPAGRPKSPGAAGASKTELLIRALSRKRPPSLAQISSTLGWQPHTTRAAISRLRKSGTMIETLRSETGGVTTYRLASATKDEAASGAKEIKDHSEAKISAGIEHQTQPIAHSGGTESHKGAAQ